MSLKNYTNGRFDLKTDLNFQIERLKILNGLDNPSIDDQKTDKNTSGYKNNITMITEPSEIVNSIKK